MEFLVINGQTGDYLLVVVIGIIVIIIGLIVYYFVSNAKSKNNFQKTESKEPVNFETKNLELLEIDEAKTDSIDEAIPLNNQNVDEENIEDEKTGNNIAVLLEQMQQDLGNDEKNRESYEAAQEENAIISYQELMKLKNGEKEKNMILEEKNVAEIKEDITNNVEVNDSKEEVKKFKRSEFISPIFGFNDGVVTYREIKRPQKKEQSIETNEWESDKLFKQLENDSAEVIELEHKKEDSKKSMELVRNENFLEALVDFRKKLD